MTKDETTQLDQATIHLTINVVLDAYGEDHDYLAQRMNSNISRAVFGNGLISGDTEAEVASHEFKTALLTPQAAALDQALVTQWITQQIKSGAIIKDELPAMLARFALADPAEIREEIAAQMHPSVQERQSPIYPVG